MGDTIKKLSNSVAKDNEIAAEKRSVYNTAVQFLPAIDTLQKITLEQMSYNAIN